jgi:deazaflavin-dependent oxidoreductase (nitroreductase family)
MERPTRRNRMVRWFPTPPRWMIRWNTRLQVWIYEKSGGRIFTRAMRMHHLLLYSIGRRSGREAVACLPYWIDPDGQRVVVASMAGGPRHPAWYHNVSDREANPEVRVRDKRQVFQARAEVLEGEERETIWKELTLDRPFYRGYREKCERQIPLVRLAGPAVDSAIR